MSPLIVCKTFFLLILGAAVAQGSTYCSKVASYFFPCTTFLFNFEPTPAEGCCSGLEELNEMAKDKKGPENICQCIEDMAYVMNFPYNASRIQSLPEECHIQFSFPVSVSMNCSRV
ncbi:hypothetical protein REPUB_Repub04eG0141200 [Reevesia pubescens]